MPCHHVILSLMPRSLNYYTNGQRQELKISFSLIKYQITATETLNTLDTLWFCLFV